LAGVTTPPAEPVAADRRWEADSGWLSERALLWRPLLTDVKFIAFTSDEGGQDEIYVQPMPPDTGKTHQVSFGGGSNPRWRRDGKELFFVSRGSIMAVDVGADGTFSAPHPLFEIKDAAPTDPTDYDVRPDGQQFLVYMDPKGAKDVPITVVLNWWARLPQQP